MRSKKSLGQHFLIRGRVVQRILQALELDAKDHVLEIGPGHGVLTRPLADRIVRLLVVEKDRELAQKLRVSFQDKPVEVLEEDFLKLPWSELVSRLGSQFKIVSNLPYNVGTAILTRLLQNAASGTLMVLMFQKEVGERLLANPGSKTYGSLSIFSRIWAESQAVAVISPEAFSPPPKVESLIVKFRIRPFPLLPIPQLRAFESFLRLGFGQRRKMLRHTLRADSKMGSGTEIEARLQNVGASAQARAEELSVEQWMRLFQSRGEALE